MIIKLLGSSSVISWLLEVDPIFPKSFAQILHCQCVLAVLDRDNATVIRTHIAFPSVDCKQKQNRISIMNFD